MYNYCSSRVIFFIHLAAVYIIGEQFIIDNTWSKNCVIFKNDCLYEHYLPVTLRTREMVIKIEKVLQEKVVAVTVLTFFSRIDITLFT
jgi:hypothetical protein